MGAAQILVDARRRFFWRLGRRAYMMARHDFHNRLTTNGELRLQHEVLTLLHNHSVAPVIFDVGANIGEWTLSLVGQARAMNRLDGLTIHAFEPFPSTFQTLSNRLRQHTENRTVRCNELALSSEDGEAYMLGTPGLETSSLHGGSESSQYDRVKVKLRKADTYSEENDIQEVHLLKCDAEGHDFEVIRGAAGLLEKGRVWFCQFEYNSRWVYSRHYLKDVFDVVAGTRYRVSKVTPAGLELYESWHPELERFFEGNYVLIRDDLVQQVTTRSVSVDSAATFA
jgi:FkbM family methyltransferase